MANPQQQMPAIIHHQRWQSQGMMPPPQLMTRINMPYNPMNISQKYAHPSAHTQPTMIYRNPMMAMNPQPYGMPPPGQAGQAKPPGSQPYDPYMYQRQ
jgi:hypothetical protein